MLNGQQTSWKPIETLHAPRYILMMVVSLAITITVTRLYLEATGYPQIGNDTIHIAHALWGGLLLTMAATLLLIYVNRWVLYLSAVLAGAGMGLFIDEIGKFITQANDYFFPLAAPIIYISVILGVLLYLYIRREDRYDARGEMYRVLDQLKPLLDQRVNHQQYEAMRIRLHGLAQQTERTDIAQMAQGLLHALPEHSDAIPVSNAGIVNKIINSLKQIEVKYFNRRNMRRILMLFFFIEGVVAAVGILALVALVSNEQLLEDFIANGIFLVNPLVDSASSLQWYLALLIVSLIIGAFYLITFIAFFIHREDFATKTALIALVISLTIGSTMSFYFNQFSVLLTSILSFTLLMMIIRYRERFLEQPEPARVQAK